VHSIEFLDALRSLLPGIALEPLPATDQKTIGVPASSIADVCRVLRETQGFLLLADITAVDWWPREPRFEVVYQLASAGDRLRVKATLAGGNARLPTVQGVWPGANWLEREVWDLFGIVFEGHGDLRRLLMPEDWEGHPLRKDFPVQIRLKPKSTEPLQVTEEQFRKNLEADKAARK
jgi:NADH-quinone oxidoreductase subunit C